jgi:ribonuclease E
VARFLHAIELSGRHAELPQWPAAPEPPAAERTDTERLPRIVLLAAVPLSALLLSGCAGAPAVQAPGEQSAPISVPATPVQPQESTGTDAGLITTPAPTVAELEAQDAAAVPAPVVVPDAPAPAPVLEQAPPAPAVEPAPVVVPEPAPVVVEPEPVQEQLPDEALGSHRCEDPAHVVLSVEPWTCGPVAP